MNLPFELKQLIFTYLPLTTLQLLNDSNYVINVKGLVKIDNSSILTPFEQYCFKLMLKGEVGYNGNGIYQSMLVYLIVLKIII